MKICPILRTDCLLDDCALWEHFTGTCSLATIAYLAGRKVSIEEAKADREGVSR